MTAGHWFGTNNEGCEKNTESSLGSGYVRWMYTVACELTKGTLIPRRRHG